MQLATVVVVCPLHPMDVSHAVLLGNVSISNMTGSQPRIGSSDKSLRGLAAIEPKPAMIAT